MAASRKSGTGRKATLNAVAERAGVSLATASRALTGTYPVATATKARVAEAAAELGYVRGRRVTDSDHRFPTVAVIAHDVRQEFLIEIVSGIEHIARGAGHFCLLGSTGYDTAVELAMLDALVDDLAIEGVIVAGGAYDTEAYRDGIRKQAQRYAEQEVPLVFCGRPGVEGAPVRMVDYDQAAGAASAVSYLLSQGHRRIAYIRGPDGFTTSEGRTAGYYSALASFGIPVDERIIKQGTDRVRSTGYQATRELLEESTDVTAVFAESDYIATGVLAAVRDSGLSVPGDISVIGFDDLSLAQETWPPLTTVHLPFEELGRAAARLVLSPPQTGSGRNRSIFGTHLVIRDSVRSLW